MVILENRKYAQIKFYCGAELFKASYISKQLFNALYAAFESCVHGALKVATPTVLGVRAWGNNPQPHRKVLAIDGFWGKRYNAESDGARKFTVPIILTVGRACRAFSSGSVNGGVLSRNLSFSYNKSLVSNTYIYHHVIWSIKDDLITEECLLHRRKHS